MLWVIGRQYKQVGRTIELPDVYCSKIKSSNFAESITNRTMLQTDSLFQISTSQGSAYAAKLSQIEANPQWSAAFSQAFPELRKDGRFYRIVEQTINPEFDYQYFIFENLQKQVVAIQPFFLLQQDLIQGSGKWVNRVVGPIRKVLPKFLTSRTLMVGCAAGEGHIDSQSPDQSKGLTEMLHEMILKYAKPARAKMLVLKEFPAKYREQLLRFSRNGFTRIPSLPMTRLSIDYPDFDQYMTKVLSKVTRKGLRRKFRDAAESAPIEMIVLDDISPMVDEAHALYMNVYNRSSMHFEKLTKAFLCRLGKEMPEKTRFFVWKQNGKMIAFSLCMIQGDSIYDEYLGLDYSVALDLHLYFYTFKDIVEWAMKNNIKWYCSSALNYDPKLHLKSSLYPLDLYVAHSSKLMNMLLRKILPMMEPTKADPILKQFANHADLWGDK